MHEIYIRDDDSQIDVYLGSQEEEPPRKITLANRGITFDGQPVFLRPACYVKLAHNGNRHIYKQE